MPNYRDARKDRRWQKKRAYILIRDKWICVQCGCRDNRIQLHVHHKKYRWRDYFKRIPADPWDCPDSDLISLCEPCHSRTHGKPVKTKRKPTNEVKEFSVLLRDRRLGETQSTFEAKRRKVLDDIAKLERGGVA